jgi:hypothetical protein
MEHVENLRGWDRIHTHLLNPKRSTKMIKMLTSIGAAAVVAATAALLWPGSASAVANNSIPFNASFSGTAVLTSQTSATFTGTGNATHLGQITTVGDAVVTGVSETPCGGLDANTNVNTETLTAANGDTLTIASDDIGCRTGQYQYHGTGNWTVTNGTGRFSDASGEGSFDGHSDFAAGTFAIDLTGTLVLKH